MSDWFIDEETIKGYALAAREALVLTLPIRAFDLRNGIKNLGGKVVFSEDLKDNIVAEIKKTQREENEVRRCALDRSFTLSLNEYFLNSAEDELIIFAREIGHLLLHMNYFSNEKWNKAPNVFEDVFTHTAVLGALKRQEAYDFALRFLIPEQVLFEKFGEYGDGEGGFDKKRMCEFFGVTERFFDDRFKKSPFSNTIIK